MPAKVLFVDDEPSVLSGYERTLRREFEVHTAVGGASGLDVLRDRGPFAVVISDMRMPGMTGAEFLAKARAQCPDTVRMLLTGYTDVNAAIQAINEGNIAKFLTKPCAKDELVQALEVGVEQYRLVTVERELLEKTVLGSIKVLADVLNASSPEAFGRSMRIANTVRHLSGKAKIDGMWRLEAAATLSQLGCITLDNETIQKVSLGIKLDPEDQARFDAHPTAAAQLLSAIPRLEPVAWIIGKQFAKEIVKDCPELPAPIAQEAVVCANLLRLAVAYDDLRVRSFHHEECVLRLRARLTEFESVLVEALVGFKAEVGSWKQKKIPTTRIGIGMILDQDIRNKQDMLLVGKGQEVTNAIMLRIENFAQAGLIDRDVVVLVPASWEE